MDRPLGPSKGDWRWYCGDLASTNFLLRGLCASVDSSGDEDPRQLDDPGLRISVFRISSINIFYLHVFIS